LWVRAPPLLLLPLLLLLLLLAMLQMSPPNPLLPGARVPAVALLPALRARHAHAHAPSAVVLGGAAAPSSRLLRAIEMRVVIRFAN
jgi:hypothetical protein